MKSTVRKIKSESKNNKYIDKLLIILGSAIVAFGLYNIHSRCGIAEGGQLGVELLFFNLLGISPGIVSIIIDGTMYIIGSLLFGKKFFFNAILGAVSYSGFYLLFENTTTFFPNLSNNLLLASIIGGIMVGIGCGIVIKNNGACGGDDALALIISKIFKLPVAISYFILDAIVILMSLSYINIVNIIYSFITALISSILIGWISKKGIVNSKETKK